MTTPHAHRITAAALRRGAAARILAQLDRAPGPATAPDLAQATGATWAWTCRILAAAAHHGLAVRVTPPIGPHPGRWVITPAGRAVCLEVRP